MAIVVFDRLACALMEKRELLWQIVPLRPFIHKVYLLVDLLLPPFGAWLVTAKITIRQPPGYVDLARWA